MGRTIIRAETAGFCMGVDLALRKLDRVVAEGGREPIYTLGPIIHNPQVLSEYAAQGVHQAEQVQEVPPESCVVIRAHGVPLATQKALQAKGVRIIDATCPKVKKAQMLIAEQTRKGRRLLLFGEPEHPEVAGLLSYADERAQLIEQLSDISRLELDPERAYCLVAQTTQDRTEFEQLVASLEQRLGSGFPVLDTICDATRERQREAVHIAQQVECMLVVGGFESGNTRRLAKVVQDQGVVGIHIQSLADLPDQALDRITRVGITAGASTPKHVIDAVQAGVQGWND